VIYSSVDDASVLNMHMQPIFSLTISGFGMSQIAGPLIVSCRIFALMSNLSLCVNCSLVA
jgi:hypothetical protein